MPATGLTHEVYPACAGIHPSLRTGRPSVPGLPRMRGDPPAPGRSGRQRAASTPHARGSTSNEQAAMSGKGVYPACAGIHREGFLASGSYWGLPRMRGDPPGSKKNMGKSEKSTPHARGSTVIKSPQECPWRVYPACAGIHRHPMWSYSMSGSLPRMRGDPPCSIVQKPISNMSTPHARGSTRVH